MVRLLAPPPLLLAAREARATEVVDLSRPAVPVALLLCLCLLVVEPAAALVYPPGSPPRSFPHSCLRAELSEQGS